MFQVATDYFNLISLYYLRQDYREELVYLKKLKQLLDRVPNYSKMDYIIKRINELDNKSLIFLKKHLKLHDLTDFLH